VASCLRGCGVFLALCIAIAPGLTFGSDAVMPDGFHEVVFSVSDLEGAARFYQDVAGWDVVYLGSGDPNLAKFWGLPGDQLIRQALLKNPGDESGFLRLVAFPGAEQKQMRSSAQTWDTGGIFDVNVRVLDVHEKFAELRKRGWQFYSDPIQFTFGPFVVWEVLAKGPDGVVFAMVERVQPPLEGWPNLRQLSHIFNSTQIVADFDTSLEFYRDKLGFKIYLEHEGPSKEAGPNVLGLPHNLATEISRKVVILSPDGTNAGSVELIGFDGLTGADFSDLAAPPNLGILALRFPISDLAAYRLRLAAHGVVPVNGPSTVDIEPYGEVEVMTIRAPEGAWLEFYQKTAVGVSPAMEE
jgi:catechol 2,3-dioxygenase-like lactoylglutathione lyase family enzyme